jgi:hypothetical protein
MYCRFHIEFSPELVLDSIEVCLVLDRKCTAGQTCSFCVLYTHNA